MTLIAKGVLEIMLNNTNLTPSEYYYQMMTSERNENKCNLLFNKNDKDLKFYNDDNVKYYLNFINTVDGIELRLRGYSPYIIKIENKETAISNTTTYVRNIKLPMNTEKTVFAGEDGTYFVAKRSVYNLNNFLLNESEVWTEYVFPRNKIIEYN